MSDKNSSPDYKTDPLGRVLHLAKIAEAPPRFLDVPESNPPISELLREFFEADASGLFLYEPNPDPDTLIILIPHHQDEEGDSDV